MRPADQKGGGGGGGDTMLVTHLSIKPVFGSVVADFWYPQELHSGAENHKVQNDHRADWDVA